MSAHTMFCSNIEKVTALTPRQRLREVADILAMGYLRHRSRAATPPSPGDSSKDLTQLPQQSVHAIEPVRRRRTR